MRYRIEYDWCASEEVPDRKGLGISDEVYMHAKRLALTAGAEAAVSYLSSKKVDNPSRFVRSLFGKDDDRSDIRLSKCMHCIFRKKCGASPIGCTCMIDERTPIWKIAFTFVPLDTRDFRVNEENPAKWIRKYECGWAQWSNGEIEQISPSNLVLMENIYGGCMLDWTGISVMKKVPGTLGLVKSGVLPLVGEKFEEYEKRIEELVKKIIDRIDGKRKKKKEEKKEKTVRETLKIIFNGLGQGETLTELYGGDEMAMCRDYFPTMTPEDVIKQYTPEKLESLTSPRKRARVTDEQIRAEAIAERRAR